MTEPTPEALHPTVEYGLKSQTHVWAITTIRSVGDDFLDHFDAAAAAGPENTLGDFPATEAILGQVIDCILCEAPYDQAQRRRKCPGRRLHPGMKWKS